MDDNFNLDRFVDAQNPVFNKVIQELENGEKDSDWMWFFFPQIHGLGYSSTSKFYAIKSINEAKAYLAHPILGPRLRHCCKILIDLKDVSALDIFEEIDEQKLLSSMTLFASLAGHKTPYQAVLRKYFKGEQHEKTLELLAYRKFLVEFLLYTYNLRIQELNPCSEKYWGYLGGHVGFSKGIFCLYICIL